MNINLWSILVSIRQDYKILKSIYISIHILKHTHTRTLKHKKHTHSTHFHVPIRIAFAYCCLCFCIKYRGMNKLMNVFTYFLLPCHLHKRSNTTTLRQIREFFIINESSSIPRRIRKPAVKPCRVIGAGFPCFLGV